MSLALIAELSDTISGPAKTVRGEPRQFVMGRAHDLTFYAVFVERGNKIRPISVRRAHRKERMFYEEELAQRRT